MPILKYQSTQPEQVNDDIQRRLVHTDSLMTAVLDLSGGPKAEPDPYHSHPHEQTCYLAAGKILFLMEGEEPVELQAGDLFYVPSGKPHAIQLLSETARLVDSFSPIREDFL
ncbi:cupin domain-containing protein [Tunicatimonas pelagia]|uniref:cupin domain-containing protein n=1 Tax=Tunicatimonas pelagia TaxID=931531 RepID=UPI0026650353|nr:cupin domain-containing protein [Tunicatimonas pelagia]WKN43640.1 cupin domain-containing protein [Tunicatimonas pelagia]